MATTTTTTTNATFLVTEKIAATLAELKVLFEKFGRTLDTDKPLPFIGVEWVKEGENSSFRWVTVYVCKEVNQDKPDESVYDLLYHVFTNEEIRNILLAYVLCEKTKQ
jgi:hypothetical protein